MKKNPKELKARFMEQVEGLFDELMAWNDETEEPDLRQIEDKVLEIRQQLSEKLAETVLESQEKRQPAAKMTCPECEGELENKGWKSGQVTSRVGGLNLRRTYYYCPRCRKGIFPPGSAAEVVGTALE